MSGGSPEKPREGPRPIVHPSFEKNFPAEFHDFGAKYAKEYGRYKSKIYNQYFIKTRGGPTNVPKLLYSPLLKNISQLNFITFARNVFHHFEIFFRSFSTV